MKMSKNAESFMEFYELADIFVKLDLWYNLWKEKDLAAGKLKKIKVSTLLEEVNIFFLVIRCAFILNFFLSTIATTKISFSILRRVKTWLRSTIGENRQTGLCLISVHRKFLKKIGNGLKQKF